MWLAEVVMIISVVSSGASGQLVLTEVSAASSQLETKL